MMSKLNFEKIDVGYINALINSYFSFFQKNRPKYLMDIIYHSARLLLLHLLNGHQK